MGYTRLPLYTQHKKYIGVYRVHPYTQCTEYTGVHGVYTECTLVNDINNI